MNNATAIPVEHNVQASTAKIIPFRFEAREVRTLLIGGEPWFVASDVCKALGIVNTTQALQALDEDERSMFNIGRQGKANIVDESGLFTLILRSREATTAGTPQHRFRKWVTAEVLPSIRKHGRYEDDGKMATLMDELIGMTELGVIKGVIRDKAQAVPAERRHGFQLAMHNRLHTRFNVPRTELIPAAQFEAACNFVAAYVIEGEWLPKEKQVSTVGPCEWSSVGVLINCIEQCWQIMERSKLSHHLSSLGCKTGIEISSFLYDALGSAAHVKKHCANELDWRKQA